jgi:hypothetical protein
MDGYVQAIKHQRQMEKQKEHTGLGENVLPVFTKIFDKNIITILIQILINFKLDF